MSEDTIRNEVSSANSMLILFKSLLTIVGLTIVT